MEGEVKEKARQDGKKEREEEGKREMEEKRIGWEGKGKREE